MYIDCKGIWVKLVMHIFLRYYALFEKQRNHVVHLKLGGEM